VGNRAQGKRTSHFLSPGQLKIGAALVLMAPFVPMLFQGEEWAASTPFLFFTDHREKELAAAVRRGRRQELARFGWNPDDIPDPQAEQTFHRSKLNWEELSRPPHSDLLRWHRSLIALRRRSPALTDGRLGETEVGFDETAQWLTMTRGSVVVACNFSESGQRVPCPHLAGKSILLSSEEKTAAGPSQTAAGSITVSDDAFSLPGHAVAILAD
jgi:maltooligosyltrehalose trehalohydrolase